MPHFLLDCSRSLLTLRAPEELIREVHATAEASGLFAQGDIKVRIRAYDDFTVGGTMNDFLHVFGHIMQGRTTAQRKALSVAIVKRLKELLPAVPVISMNVAEFERDTYTNRTMV
jgi:5-carboxymethyl-2-hydroxymuconate isomerase